MARNRCDFILIKGDLTVVQPKATSIPRQNERNLQLARDIMGEQDYRVPWGEDNAAAPVPRPKRKAP